MMEYISELKLQDEITRQRKEKTNLFEKMSLSRKRLKEIENAGNFIQSRAVVKKITSVKRYEREQNKLSDLKNDFNDLQIYLPENPHELEKVGDGSQSYFAFKLVPQHEEMWGHGIPYEWHKHIGVSGEERMGNWFNQHPENAGDYIEGEDILKSIRNTIITNKDVILNKEGLPNMNQPFIDQCFKDQRYKARSVDIAIRLGKRQRVPKIKKPLRRGAIDSVRLDFSAIVFQHAHGKQSAIKNRF